MPIGVFSSVLDRRVFLWNFFALRSPRDFLGVIQSSSMRSNVDAIGRRFVKYGSIIESPPEFGVT
ncbi:MAG: hypothetical protein L3K23_08330 [Thermoplasmata archaeon]|nr:hypothetical protein [Thermoplasmata archaeon]